MYTFIKPAQGDATGADLSKTLVERFARCQLQPLDLVLDHQFAAFQLNNVEIVCGWMGESLVQFAFQNPMFTFQFNEMRLYCHATSPRLWDLRFDQGSWSVHQSGRLSMGIKN
jgi:hypothetical protein